MRLRKIIISLIAVAGLTGIGNLTNTNVHAYDSDLTIPKDPNGTEFNYFEDHNWDNYVNDEFDREYHLGEYKHHSQKYWNNYYNKLDDAYDKSENKKRSEEINALNRSINQDSKAIHKDDIRAKKEQDRSNNWYRNRIYSVHKRICYVKYNGFSKHQYRLAFPSWGSDNATDKLGLSNSFSSVKRAINSGKKYRANVTVKPGSPVWLRLINDSYDIYKAHYNKHSYYYAEDYDPHESEISPFTGEYYKGSFESTLKPWKCKYIVLSNKHELHNGSYWNYNYDNSLKTNQYKYHNGKWHDTGNGDDSPDWLE